MSTNEPIYGTCKENSGKTLRARINGHAATPITQASLTTFKYAVTKYSSRDDAIEDTNGTVVVAETALTISAVIFDALQSWDVDSTGYNMAHALAATSFPDGNVWYRVEYWADPTSGEDFLAALFFLECMATTR